MWGREGAGEGGGRSDLGSIDAYMLIAIVESISLLLLELVPYTLYTSCLGFVHDPFQSVPNSSSAIEQNQRIISGREGLSLVVHAPGGFLGVVLRLDFYGRRRWSEHTGSSFDCGVGVLPALGDRQGARGLMTWVLKPQRCEGRKFLRDGRRGRDKASGIDGASTDAFRFRSLTHHVKGAPIDLLFYIV